MALDTDIAVDREMLELNTLGTISLTKATLPFMVERHEGHVVVISSVAGKLGVPVSSSYCASKHALQAIVHCSSVGLSNSHHSLTRLCIGIFQYSSNGTA